jgi:GntR family transcriptional regulator / MocR family aminotransferase
MANGWAISGLDLHIDLAGPRRRAALETAIRRAVQEGTLAPGTKVPPSRTLAADLGIARNTVADAYAQLVAEGWLSSRQGSGTVVSSRAQVTAAVPRRADYEPSPPRYDLRPGRPDVSSFPVRDWLTATRAALERAPHGALDYGDPRGRQELRTELAAYLGRARGVRADPARMMICSGFTQGLALVAGVLRRQGRGRIGVEAYGHRLHRDVLTEAGLTLTGLPVDGQGADTSRLEGLDAVLLTPAHQFPLGHPLSPERRTAFASWAARTGGVIIEDDYDGEFRYDRRPVGALQALAPDHVVYAGTASKTLAPGLRLGWLVAPESLIVAAAEPRARSDVHTSAIEQLALAELISSGRFDRHVRKARLTYRRRRDQLVAALQHRVPALAVTDLAAGLLAVIDLPPGTDEDAVVDQAAESGLALAALGEHAFGPADRGPALVVGYATPPAHAYAGALSRLTAVLAEVVRVQG